MRDSRSNKEHEKKKGLIHRYHEGSQIPNNKETSQTWLENP